MKGLLVKVFLVEPAVTAALLLVAATSFVVGDIPPLAALTFAVASFAAEGNPSGKAMTSYLA